MEEKATGLILRVRPLTETSLIVHWLTAELGRVATVAKGARRPKSPFRGKLDLFYLGSFTFVRSRRSDLHNLREAALIKAHHALREDLERLQLASECARLIERATVVETPLPGVYELMSGLLDNLSLAEAGPMAKIAFEVKLLAELGLQPDAGATNLSGGARRILEKVATLDWSAIGNLRPSPAQVKELEKFLLGFLAYHLEA